MYKMCLSLFKKLVSNFKPVLTMVAKYIYILLWQWMYGLMEGREEPGELAVNQPPQIA